MSRKKIILLFVILCLILSFTITVAAKVGDLRDLPRPPKPEKSYTIGVALPHLANPHFLGHAYGYFEEGKALGVDIILFEAGGYKYIDRQVQQIEDFISMGVDAIIICATSGEGTMAIVDEAAAAGIPVINTNVMTNSTNVVTRIRSDDSYIGQLQAEYMAKELNNKGKVIMLPGPAGTSWAMGRSAGFRATMEKNFPDIEILDEQFCDSDPAAGLALMEDMLLAYPDLEGVMTGSDFLGVGAAEALFQAGKSGKIVLTTSDSQKACINGVREGKIAATMVQAPCYMASWGVRAAVMTLEGREDELAERYWTPILVCDKNNVETFEFVGVSRPPDGWELPR